VSQLIDRGHDVIGTYRSPAHEQRVSDLGAKAVSLDLLDTQAVQRAVLESEAEAIVHQATALSGISDFKHFDRTFAQTNRLRTEGTDTLLAAARAAGIDRFAAQSFASYRTARTGALVKAEDDELDPNPVASTRESNAAMR